MQESTDHPVHSFPKGDGEELKIALRKYKDRYYVDIRVWYWVDETQSFRPTKKGLCFSLDYWENFASGLGNVPREWKKIQSESSKMAAQAQ